MRVEAFQAWGLLLAPSLHRRPQAHPLGLTPCNQTTTPRTRVQGSLTLDPNTGSATTFGSWVTRIAGCPMRALALSLGRVGRCCEPAEGAEASRLKALTGHRLVRGRTTRMAMDLVGCHHQRSLYPDPSAPTLHSSALTPNGTSLALLARKKPAHSGSTIGPGPRMTSRSGTPSCTAFGSCLERQWLRVPTCTESCTVRADWWLVRRPQAGLRPAMLYGLHVWCVTARIASFMR